MLSSAELDDSHKEVSMALDEQVAKNKHKQLDSFHVEVVERFKSIAELSVTIGKDCYCYLSRPAFTEKQPDFKISLGSSGRHCVLLQIVTAVSS